MLEIHSVTRNYGDFVLDVKDLIVQPSTISGLVGHNGAGKTTFMKLVSGILPAPGVSVTIDGEICSSPLALRNMIAYVPDKPAVYDWMTPAEFIRFFAETGYSPLSETLHSLEALEVPMHKRISRLSHGTRNKLNLAIAFARPCPYILMDEPLSGLDMRSREELIAQLIQLVQSSSPKKGVLISTHSITDLETLCENVLVFRRGSCVLASSMNSVQNDWYIDPTPQATPAAGDRRSNSHPHIVPRSSITSSSGLRTASPLEVFLALG